MARNGHLEIVPRETAEAALHKAWVVLNWSEPYERDNLHRITYAVINEYGFVYVCKALYYPTVGWMPEMESVMLSSADLQTLSDEIESARKEKP